LQESQQLDVGNALFLHLVNRRSSKCYPPLFGQGVDEFLQLALRLKEVEDGGGSSIHAPVIMIDDGMTSTGGVGFSFHGFRAAIDGLAT
jgi:hypothetical protein